MYTVFTVNDLLRRTTEVKAEEGRGLPRAGRTDKRNMPADTTTYQGYPTASQYAQKQNFPERVREGKTKWRDSGGYYRRCFRQGWHQDTCWKCPPRLLPRLSPQIGVSDHQPMAEKKRLHTKWQIPDLSTMPERLRG